MRSVSASDAAWSKSVAAAAIPPVVAPQIRMPDALANMPRSSAVASVAGSPPLQLPTRALRMTIATTTDALRALRERWDARVVGCAMPGAYRPVATARR